MDLSHDSFSICYDAELVDVVSIQRRISDLGFRPRIVEDDDATELQARGARAGAVPEPVAAALAGARESGELLLIDFFAEWCPPCKVLDEVVLPHPSVQDALSGYRTLRVDTDRFPEAGRYYEVHGMPMLLVLDAGGEERYRFIGVPAPLELAQRLTELRSGLQ